MNWPPFMRNNDGRWERKRERERRKKRHDDPTLKTNESKKRFIFSGPHYVWQWHQNNNPFLSQFVFLYKLLDQEFLTYPLANIIQLKPILYLAPSIENVEKTTTAFFFFKGKVKLHSHWATKAQFSLLLQSFYGAVLPQRGDWQQLQWNNSSPF